MNARFITIQNSLYKEEKMKASREIKKSGTNFECSKSNAEKIL
jgi:hypothetical protein